MAAIATAVLIEACQADESSDGLSWGIIGSVAAQETGLVDLLTLRLSEDDRFRLVERADLAKVVSEQQFAAALQDQGSGSRLQIGKLIGADRLVLLDVRKRPGDGLQFVEMTVCITAQGARLARHAMPIRSYKLPTVIDDWFHIIDQVEQQYRGGIRYLVGVPPFVTDDVLDSWRYLQSGFAGLLEAGLRDVPGGAVVEMSEARSIARELSLSRGELVNRVVPLFVSGEFKVRREGDKRHFDLTLRLMQHNAAENNSATQTIEYQGLTLDAASDLLRGPPARKLLKVANTQRQTPLTRREQSAALWKHAGMMTMFGRPDLAAGLLDAALLVEDNSSMRRFAVAFCVAAFQQTREPDGVLRHPETNTRLQRESVTNQQLFNVSAHWFHRATEHVEYLMRNRQISLRFAADLQRQILRNADPVIRKRGQPSFEAEALAMRERFFWRSVELAGGLEQGSSGSRQILNATASDHEQWAYDCVFWITDTRPRAKEPRDYSRMFADLERFLTRKPRASWPLDRCAWHVATRTHLVADGYLSTDAFRDFYKRLAKLGEDNQFYARLGLLRLDLSGADANSADDQSRLVDELNQLNDQAATYFARIPDGEREPISKSFDAHMRDFRTELDRRNTTITQRVHRLPVNPIPLRDPEPRVTFHATDIRTAWYRLMACDGEFDAMWNDSVVTARIEPDRETTVLKTNLLEGRIMDVAWDGEQFWVALSRGGVVVVSPDGKRVGRIPVRPDTRPRIVRNTGTPTPTENDDLSRLLPPWTVRPSGRQDQLFVEPPILHAIEPGRCLVVGNARLQKRTWCAELTYEVGREVNANLIYTSTRVPTPNRLAGRPRQIEDSVDVVFLPTWKAELNLQGNRHLLIGRPHTNRSMPRRPLDMDLQTLEVRLFPQPVRSHPGDYAPRLGAGSDLLCPTRTGLYCYACEDLEFGSGVEHTLLSPKPRLKNSHVEQPRKQFLLSKGDVYSPGTRWRRVDRQHHELEDLSRHDMPLKWRFMNYGVSAHNGLVAWNVGGLLYEVHIDESAPEDGTLATQYPFVPAVERERHHLAIRNIQAAGGHVDSWWDTTYGKPPSWIALAWLPAEWTAGDAGLKDLADLHNLAKLWVVDAHVTNDGLRTIGRLHTLSDLTLAETQATDEGLRHLSDLTGLASLHIESTPGSKDFTDGGLESLSRLHQLKKLTLCGPGYTDRTLAFVEKMPVLFRLNMYSTHVSKAAIGEARQRKPKLQVAIGQPGMWHPIEVQFRR
jgi:hypothetical protein